MRGLRIGYMTGPRLGGHGSDFDLAGSGTSPQTVTVETSGPCSLIVPAFGYLQNISQPTDNKGNTFVSLGSSGYAGGLWSGYGLELWAKANAAGGSGHTVSVVKATDAADESTVAVVEARGASVLQDYTIVNRAAAGAGVSYSSGNVVTTGPALLVSVWGGDGGTGLSTQEANPEAGWSMIESLFLAGTAYIQMAVAVRQVGAAGTYACAWTPVDNQGAIVAIAAFQA